MAEQTNLYECADGDRTVFLLSLGRLSSHYKKCVDVYRQELFWIAISDLQLTELEASTESDP